jgi:dienelactone hydrolase
MRALQFDLGTEAVAPFARALGSDAGVDESFLEYSSRGDRVPVRVLVPSDRTGACPLVVVGHGLGGDKHAAYIDAATLHWVRQGAAVAVIDFPLHGERASAKLSERVTDREQLDPDLWLDLVEQAVVDLRRLLLAVESDERIDSARVAYAGFSLGTLIGSIFCAEEERVCAAALAIGGAGIGPAGANPADWVGRIAPRPVLFLQADRDETIPREAALALHAAAGQPHEVHWVDSDHGGLPGTALKKMWTFLAARLNL